MPPSFNARFNPLNSNIDDRDLPHIDWDKVDWDDAASIVRSLGGGQGTGIPIPPKISSKEVRKQAGQRSTQIFRDWELLGAILDRHETTVHKRWLKKK